MDDASLKAQLTKWSDPGGGPADVPAFVEEHLHALGSLDPELRDLLFYEVVDGWIGEGRIALDPLLRLARRLVSAEFLFKGLGEPRGNDVFRRTFSLLILDSIVRRLNALEGTVGAHLASIAEGMERYVTEEIDLRGHVAPQGWAHAPAHAADVLASLAASPHLEGAWDRRILAMVQALLLRSEQVYTHQEDRRLARVAKVIGLRRPDEVQCWASSLQEACPASFSDMTGYARRTNLLDFLRALYFHLHAEPSGHTLAGFVEIQVRGLMRIR